MRLNPAGPAAPLLAALALILFAAPGVRAQTSVPAPAADSWVSIWGSSQYAPEPQNALPAADLQDATLRQTVRVTAAGDIIQARISNAFGAAPLTVTAAGLARPVAPGGSAVDPESQAPLLFDGKPGVVIPPGADWLSDPVAWPVAALTDVAVSLHLADASGGQTGHPGARATTFVAPGNQVSAQELTQTKTVERWYFLAAIQASDADLDGAVVILGDSITDGYGVPADTHQRWPDRLAARLQADPATRGLSVVNQGIGGNRVLLDGLGPNLLARFERDGLSHPGVRFLIILQGVNDLGVLTRDRPATPQAHAALVQQMTGAYRQIVERARARGVRVIGATILPYGGSAYYHPTVENEADRQALNAWIRTPGNFDAVLDFDRIMRDPDHPDRLRPEVDSGDGLHPSMAGYVVMGDAVPLTLFQAPPPPGP
jgi:lysophospholipase L1-like esterase